MSRFTFGFVIVCSILGGVGSPTPALAASDWGYTCSEAPSLEDKKHCCVLKQSDCNAECFGNYRDDALKTCQRLCNEKGDQCREEIRGETSGAARPEDHESQHGR